MRLAENLRAVQQEIIEACAVAHRDPQTVSLIAATKYVGADIMRELYNLGVKNFGENRVEAAVAKAAALADLPDIRWHFIGHLQRNKAKKILPAFAAVHSVESMELLKILDQTAAAKKLTLEILLEINLGGEDTKNGLPLDFARAAEFARAAIGCANLRLTGLMGMAPLDTDNESARPFFRNLAELRDRLQETLALPLPQLSMGMSHDFAGAIREGATWIRVGSRLFQR